jgi:arylsulfatase A-like enzyme
MTSRSLVRGALVALAAVAVVAAIRAWGRGGAGRGGGARTIVLVTVDTLRRDHVGAFAPESPAKTPRLDRLAAAGVRFTDARTPAVLTLPAHTTMFSALPPSRHGVRSNSASRVPPPERRPFALLAERFRDDGRRTGAFVSAGPLAKRYGLDAGFEAYDDGDLDDRTSALYPERAGTETVALALTWLRALPSDARVFLFVHLFEPHEPHDPGLSPAEGYRRDVERADAAVGHLLDGLEATGRGDAVVLLASDHGEALGEMGEPTHGFLLGESVLRVPFAVAGAGVPRGAARGDPVDLADVAPTLLSLGGLSPGAGDDLPGTGRDLFAGAVPAARPRVAEALHAHHQFRWAQLSCAVVGPWKLEDRGEGREVLFRTSDAGPPWQDEGVPAAGRPEAEAPAEALRAWRRAQAGGGREPGVAPIGYGAGGPVGPLLDARANAKRNDPYVVIGDAGALAQVANALPLPPPRLREWLPRIEGLAGRDPENPAVPFWLGRYLRRLGDLEGAAAAFDRALALGRVDAETLLLAMGTWADRGDRKTALERLRFYGPSVAPDVRVLCLEARLWADEGDAEKSRDAGRRAREAVRGPKDRERLEEGGCP